MSSSRLNFEIDAGASWNESIIWQNQNITGRSLRMQLKRKRGGQSLLDLTTGNGRIVVVDATEGSFTLNLNATETAELSGEYVYDLELVEDSDATDVVKLVHGRLYVWPEVTV